MFLKTMGRKKVNRVIALLARSKWKSTGKIISKVLIGPDVKHEEFMLVSNEAQNYPFNKVTLKGAD